MRTDRRDLACDLARRLSPHVPEALASGAFTFAWYALPDVVPSRRARAAAKAALLVPVVGFGVVQGRRAAASAEARDGAPAATEALARIRDLTRAEPVLDASVLRADGGGCAHGSHSAHGSDNPDDAGRAGGRPDHLPSARQAVLVGVGLAAVAGAVAGTVAAERGIHRYAQRLGARGVHLPHTRVGVVAGLATAVLSLGTACAEPPR